MTIRIFNLPILIRWDKFSPGSSFFIPCLERGKMERLIKSEADRLKVEVLCKQVIERGVYGLRVWRVDRTIRQHSTSRTEKLSPR